MARFDVFAGSGAGHVLDCQSEFLAHFKTRFVIPLLPAEGKVTASRLHPILNIDGGDFVLVTQLASAIPVSELGPKIAHVTDQQLAIMNAIDLLISGY